MPELPEVETVRRGLAPVMEGSLIRRAELRRPDLRFPFPSGFAGALEGRRVVSLGRRAKYLLIDLDGGDVVIAHLGMSGSFRVEGADAGETPGDFHRPRGKDARHDHVVLTGDRINDAQAGFDNNNQPAVHLNLDNNGARFIHLMGHVPRELAKHSMAMLGSVPELHLVSVQAEKLGV